MMVEEYVSRNYVLKCLEDSWKNGGIPYEAKSKFIKWLMKAPAVIAPKPMEKPLTNADRIRMMTGEELADILASMCPPGMTPTETCFYALGDDSDGVDSACDLCWLDWLKQEAE